MRRKNGERSDGAPTHLTSFLFRDFRTCRRGERARESAKKDIAPKGRAREKEGESESHCHRDLGLTRPAVNRRDSERRALFNLFVCTQILIAIDGEEELNFFA